MTFKQYELNTEHLLLLRMLYDLAGKVSDLVKMRYDNIKTTTEGIMYFEWSNSKGDSVRRAILSPETGVIY